MTPHTTEIRTEDGSNSILWLAGTIGASIGIAAFAYGRSRRTRWDRARERANEMLDTAREQAKPWMGLAAGGAAAGTALAVYSRNRKQSGWQRARKMASQVGSQAGPWANLAAGAAIALASAASSRKARRRAIRGINENTAETINSLTEKGLRLLQRVRNISEETRRFYPTIRRVVA